MSINIVNYLCNTNHTTMSMKTNKVYSTLAALNMHSKTMPLRKPELQLPSQKYAAHQPETPYQHLQNVYSNTTTYPKMPEKDTYTPTSNICHSFL